jgi:hypothetical protein
VNMAMKLQVQKEGEFLEQLDKSMKCTVWG